MKVKLTFMALVGLVTAAYPADYTNALGGDWEVPENWDSGAVPASTNAVTIAGSAGGQAVVMDADSWTYLINNSLTHSATEYRTLTVLLAGTGTASLEVDIGAGNRWKATSGGGYYVGNASGSDGTLNILSGSCVFEAGIMKIAQSLGSTGRINIAGADASYIAARESGGTSLSVGTGGNGTLYISDGIFQSRAGVEVGSFGMFEVFGSAVDEIGIGSYSSLDGNWQQDSGGTLKVGIDAGGITPIFVDDKDDDGTGGDVVFESGALLDVGFQSLEENGAWNIMQWEGNLSNNGLIFAPGVDTNAWSINWVDTDSTNGVDTLQVIYYSPMMTTNGTSYEWLDTYYTGLTSVAEYQAVDDSDTDGDGQLAWQEYVAGTVPTNAVSVFALKSLQAVSNDLVATWFSVPHKRYGVTQSTNLVSNDWNQTASNIVGQLAETSHVLNIGAEEAGFASVFIEPMPDLLELEAVADAYIWDGFNADANFGNVAEIKTINSAYNQMELLLKFTLPSTTEIPDSAYIWIITTADGTDPVQNAAYLVEDNSWTENGVTWNTKPVTGAEIDAWVTTNSQAIKIDVLDEVTEALKTGGSFSVAVKSPHNIGLDGMSTYASREHSTIAAPKLELKFNQPTVTVQPGESIQSALDTIHAQSGGHVVLAAGDHYVSDSLVIYSGTTLRGQGAGLSRIRMDVESNVPVLLGPSQGSLMTSDVTIKDLTVDGQQPADQQTLDATENPRNTVRGNVYGILFSDQGAGNNTERMRIENVEVTRCTMGIHVKGVNDLRIQNGDSHANGCLIGFDHNLYFRRAENTLVKNMNLSESTAGNGFNLSTDCYNVILDNCDASDNHFRGIRFEANDGGERMMIINCITSRNGLTENQPGVRVANVPDFTIIGSTSDGNGGYGFYCVNSDDGLLRDNSASGNADSNYYLPGSTYQQSNNSGW
ncbi:Alginate lyase 7 [Pontiella desulfatans]|uniref:Probable pectate lyase C n=1 Tax=Pontiella desulfatans TaxID=2750659 RepID=A0A6C2TZX5_PONDE|nr:DNRLRE domain-containing protein [Pontiella desulfatans]VGO13163.1 Alginate lyase 7 [Pontiella desulfatans]